jgi:cell division protease FtsH
MDDIQIVTNVTTQSLMSELRMQLPRFGKLLGESPENLFVMEEGEWVMEHMGTDWRDVAVERHGTLPDMPPVIRFRQQAEHPTGVETVVYESRLDPSLKYLIWSARGPRWDEHFVVMGKDKVFRLARNAIRLTKQANDITKIPILPDGVLDKVVQNTVGFLRQSRRIKKFGVKIKRGLILDGEPGNGKTMLCRYIQKLCSQYNISWGVVTSADIDDAYEHKTLNDLFSRDTVTFFDDIDVAYMDRKRGNAKMACSLLTAMDGMNEEGHLVRIFTTNEPVEDMDPAFVRPGRIDEAITLTKPDAKLRRKLVETVWPAEIRDAIDTDKLVEKSDSLSFAEIEAIRTILVTNHILNNEGWNLDKAFAEFHERRAEGRRKGRGMGFGSR